MSQRIAPAAPTTSTTCFLGAHCTWIGPGHSLAFAQDHIALADHRGWRDALVHSVTPGGWISLTIVDDDAQMLLWSHSDVASTLVAGEPAAVNVKHHVLVAGPSVYNVLVA